MQTTAQWKSARILKNVLETRGTSCYSDFREKPIIKTSENNSPTENNNYIISKCSKLAHKE